MITSVLFVCHANTARSVMAHALLEHMLVERSAVDRVRVRSGGVASWARDGMLPSLDARLALREIGVHLAENGFASTALRYHRELIAEADLVLTMTREQKTMVSVLAEARGTILTLREFAGEEGDIGDPSAGGEEGFRACLDVIQRCLDRTIERFLS